MYSNVKQACVYFIRTEQYGDSGVTLSNSSSCYSYLQQPTGILGSCEHSVNCMARNFVKILVAKRCRWVSFTFAGLCLNKRQKSEDCGQTSARMFVDCGFNDDKVAQDFKTLGHRKQFKSYR